MVPFVTLLLLNLRKRRFWWQRLYLFMLRQSNRHQESVLLLSSQPKTAQGTIPASQEFIWAWSGGLLPCGGSRWELHPINQQSGLQLSGRPFYSITRTHNNVSEKPTCFISCGVCRHTPGTGLAAFGNHDSKLIHGVWFEARDSVTERCGVCGLDTQ